MDLTIISTYRCNSKCQMCYIWKNPTDPKEEITAEHLSKLPKGFDNLNISGGEPTLRKDLYELVETVHPKARVVEISSNGLNAEKILPIIKKFPDVKVRFSLDGREEHSNSIRGETDGFRTKLEGIRALKRAGGKDLGFAITIQDENAKDLVWLYQLAKQEKIELATSTIHNAWQFHKNDNYFYDRLPVAKEVEQLINQMMKTYNPKNWFRAYLNLGLIQKILGQDRLIPCTAAKDFAFIDPWGDVWACNVRTDLPMGNLKRQDWSDIIHSDIAKEAYKKVQACQQNCWMVTTARTAMRSNIIKSFPKTKPLLWVIQNKIKLIFSESINFEKYIDYSNIAASPHVQRNTYLGKNEKRNLQKENDEHYTLKNFDNK